MQREDETGLSGIGCFARLFWLFFGNVLLLFLLVFISEKAEFPSWMDVAFWATVGSLILVRYIDIRYLNGQTGEGKPASMQDWRRHAMLVAPLALGAWIVTHVLRHLLR